MCPGILEAFGEKRRRQGVLEHPQACSPVLAHPALKKSNVISQITSPRVPLESGLNSGKGCAMEVGDTRDARGKQGRTKHAREVQATGQHGQQ